MVLFNSHLKQIHVTWNDDPTRDSTLPQQQPQSDENSENSEPKCFPNQVWHNHTMQSLTHIHMARHKSLGNLEGIKPYLLCIYIYIFIFFYFVCIAIALNMTYQIWKYPSIPSWTTSTSLQALESACSLFSLSLCAQVYSEKHPRYFIGHACICSPLLTSWHELTDLSALFLTKASMTETQKKILHRRSVSLKTSR